MVTLSNCLCVACLVCHQIIRQEGLRALYISFPTTFIMNLPYRYDAIELLHCSQGECAANSL